MAFVGYINGSTYRNGKNITYQSMIDGELVYEYQIKQMFKKSASLRCAGCRSAMRNGTANPEFKPAYISGKIDFEAKTVMFKKDPDMEPHCCELLYFAKFCFIIEIIFFKWLQCGSFLCNYWFIGFSIA